MATSRKSPEDSEHATASVPAQLESYEQSSSTSESPNATSTHPSKAVAFWMTKSAEVKTSSLAPPPQRQEPAKAAGMKRQRSISPHQGQRPARKMLAPSRGSSTTPPKPLSIIKTEPASPPSHSSSVAAAPPHINDERAAQRGDDSVFMERARAPSPTEALSSSSAREVSTQVDNEDMLRSTVRRNEIAHVDIVIYDERTGREVSRSHREVRGTL